MSRMVDRTLYCSDFWGNAIYKTEDGGQTWTKIYIPDVLRIFDIDVYPQNPDFLYMCAGGGEFIGSDIYFHTTKVEVMDYDPYNKLFYYADNYSLNSQYMKYNVTNGSLDTLLEGTNFNTVEINCGPGGGIYLGFYETGDFKIFTRGDAPNQLTV